ncbi:tape measure protein [Leyella stercorea]|uniref:tape measure protein n=1 Tax=Leyella stercorea TaxID=363265 RepID=UPI0026DD1EE4|nr:tape measure protein [Leyella stercorea]
MGNSALGAALAIPQSALDAIKEADQKLKDIQNTAKNTAVGVAKSFKDMAVGTQPFLDALDKVVAKLNVINASAANVSGGLNNIGVSAGSMSGNITQASQNIQQIVAQLSNMKGAGTSSIMQAVFAFQRLQEATKGASGMNIAELKKEIGAIDSILKDTSYNLTKTNQDSLIKRKKTLQDELKYQQQMCEERVIAFQKALDKMSSAEASFNAKQRKAYSDRSKKYQEQNYEQNTSYKGALNFSAAANTLNRQARAIEYLRETRMKLSQTDADYKQKLETLNAAIARHTQSLKEAGESSRNLSKQTSYMSGYISRWAQRMAFAFSVNTVQGFVEQIATVRGQFELSQRSLESILQNKPKADEIFNKTVELAVKSPFRIKDLVDYTRQLSAYRIESDKLYDTTKRLADVSAGLGVDMGRLILAYGQVKAAAYLRGSEVRQFTEAGINMYGELQQYFKEVKGEAYTTAQIVDMISKRKVTFEDVEAIFQRMTDKGGTFYNMQEIQAETLQGKISNLKDAFDVMLNDIGKSNEGTFKGLISSVTELLNSWRTIVNVAKIFAGLLASIYVTTKLTNGAWGQTAANIMASHKRLGVFKALMAALTGGTAKLGSTFTTLGNTIKASLPLAALTAVIALVQELISVNNEYKEAMAKNTKEYYTAQVRVEEIDAEAKTNIQKALQDLVKEMNQKGFEVTIGVNISEEEARNQYDILLKDYQEFLDNMRAIDAKYEANKKKGWLMGDDDIETDMQEYTSSMGEFLQKGDDIRSILAQVSKESVNLTDNQKEMFKQLAAGPQEGQSLLDYYAKVAKALKEIGYIQSGWFGSKQNMVGILGGTGNNGYDWGIGANADEQLSKFALTYETYIKNLEEVRKEAQSVFGDVSKYKDEASKKKLQIQIDNEAIKRRWGDIEKDMLYKTYSIKVNIDKNNTQKEVSWVDDFISRFFAEKKYDISLVVKEIDDDKAFEGFLGKGDQAAKAAKNWQEVEKRLAAVRKNQKEIKIDDSIRNIFKVGEIPLAQKTISVDTVRKKVKAYKEAAIKEAKSLGVDPFEKQNNKLANQRAKEQRDILQERISLLKDMNAKYNELIKIESKERALTDTRKYFKEAAQNVGWNANDILPDDKSIAKRIREIGNQYKDVGKRGNALRIAADIELNISKTEYDKLKDDISRNIEDSFSQLQLYKKLKDEGLSDTLIKNMFGDITTSFEDIRKSIDDEFNKYIFKDYESIYGGDINKWSKDIVNQYNKDISNTANVLKERFGDSDIYKQYLDQVQKLDKQVYQDQVEQTQKLIKAYKQQLSDQLQLDKWYYEERYKLENDPNLTKDMKKQLQANLDAQYKKKTDENTWKDFKESDMYIAIFENLDQTSSRVLTAMRKKLSSLRDNLKDLSPEQLKQIVQQMEKVDELLADRNPFKGLSNDIAKYVKFASKRNQLEKDYLEATENEDKLKNKSKDQNKIVELAKQKYERVAKEKGEDSKEAEQAQEVYDIEKKKLDLILKELEAQGLISKDLAEQIRDGQAAEKSLSQKIHGIGENFSNVADIINGTFEALNDWGLNVEMSDELREVADGISKIGSSLSEIDATKPLSVVKGVIGVLGGIGKTLGGIFGWGTKDKKLQKQIEKHQKSIEKLQDAYNDLKEAMDEAFDISMLAKYNNEMVKNLKTQNAHLEAMIKAESSKKKKDKEKIEEYRKQIKENEKAIKEAEESLTEQLGGFGSKSNYKSAAEAFAQAWVDAFKEGSDTLDALNDKFNEYIKNLIVKQAAMRLVGKMLEPVFKAIDDAVAEGSEGGNNGLEATKSELQKAIDIWGQISPALDENLKRLMDAMGYKPGLNSNLSALQQGIQAVTENTAQALESLLNSMRFYLATQQADVRIIRDTLIERLGASVGAVLQDANNNPVLVELRLQTTLLTDIRDTLSSCVKSGHSQGNKGIKVFMN